MADNTPNLSRLFQTAGKQNQQQGTGYTNLNRVFEANKGNVLGQSVAGNVQKQVGNVQNQLGEQQKQFQSEADKNKIGTDTDKQNRDAVIGRFNDPSGVAGQVSDQDISAFEKYRSGTYAGPTALKDTASLQNTANQLRSQVSNFSPSGTQELLRRSVGGNRYTQGQQRLDSLLMDKSKLVPVQRQASTLGQQVNRADLAASGQAELYKNQARQFADETQSQLNQGLTSIDTSVQKQLADAQSAEARRQASVKAIQDAATNKQKFTDDLVVQNSNDIQNMYGTDQYGYGDVLKKQYGNTANLQSLDALYNQLKTAGADSAELSSIFGSKGGTLADTHRQYAQSDMALSEAQKALEFAKGSSGEYNGKTAAEYQNDINQLSSARTSAMSDKGLIGEMINKAGLASFQNNAPVNLRTQGVNEADFDPIYTNIANAVKNSNKATNLTAQGIASQSQRANYEALTRLIGKQAADAKYRTSDPAQYQAGNLTLDPASIRKALGY